MKSKKHNYRLNQKKENDKIISHGIIVRRLRDREYQVELENGSLIVGRKLSKFRVSTNKIMTGDKVVVEIPINQTTFERGDIVGFA